MLLVFPFYFIILNKLLLCCGFVSLCSPRIVETRGRWATHRNFGLSMQPGGYVHDYVMNVFATHRNFGLSMQQGEDAAV
jgi:hypothetical protein